MHQEGQLVRLLTYVNEAFRPPQIVKITRALPLPMSDTVVRAHAMGLCLVHPH